jgi:hypothetical protein
VLEASGLVVTEKRGRTRECRISSAAVLCVERWLSERRKLWDYRFDQLERLVESDGNKVEPEQPCSKVKGE